MATRSLERSDESIVMEEFPGGNGVGVVRLGKVRWVGILIMGSFG